MYNRFQHAVVTSKPLTLGMFVMLERKSNQMGKMK